MSLTGDYYNNELSLTGINSIEDDVLTTLSVQNLNVSSSLNLTGNLNVVNTTVTPTNLSYLSGLSQNIQEQINDSTAYLANYMLISVAVAQFQPKSLMSNYLTTSTASSTYLSKTSASSTYQTIANMINYKVYTLEKIRKSSNV